MADFVLASGKEITFDFNLMNYGQWLGLFDATESDETSAETIARVCGLTVEELKLIPFPEHKRLIARFFKRAGEPLADPNA